MEIKPTKKTTQILTTIINSKPQYYCYLMGNKKDGVVCFYPLKKKWIMIYQINDLREKHCLFEIEHEFILLIDNSEWGIFIIENKELSNKTITIKQDDNEIMRGLIKRWV